MTPVTEIGAGHGGGVAVRDAPLPLPDGALLLHIGVPKTGTTVLQDSLAAARTRLAGAGLIYPGTLQEHSRAALSVLGQTWGWRGRGGRPVQPTWWSELVDEVTASSGRVMVSSEFLCEADEGQVARVVDGLGGDRVHAVLTLRPLGRLLPSSWQQYLKNGLSRGYSSWLKAVLAEPPDRTVTPSFWRRHDHGAVVQRWVDLVGPDRVNVLVLDARDHSFLPRTFEALLGLPDGLLDPREDARSNRSLTAAEAELLRRVNRDVRGLGLSWRDYESMLRKGAVLRMVEQREPQPAEPRIATPQWALDRAAEFGERAASTIAASGARVLGDLGALATDHGSAVEPAPADTAIPLDAAVAALVGAAVAPAARTEPLYPPVQEDPEMHRVEQLTARELASVLRARAMRGLARRLGRQRRTR